MAIVLEVSLTLNPNNQIAYLADFTSLVEDEQYVITATYLQNDTRFTFHGNLDITLTKPPISVPAAGTVVPAEISTPAVAAPPPLPVIYPFSAKERLDASNLNASFEFDPANVPPHSQLGGAGKFKYWVDTSTPVPSLRQCIVPRASVTYNSAEWLTLGTIDAAAGKFHFNGSDVDFLGGEGGGSTIFNVTNLTVVGATNLTTLVVSGATNLTTLQVSGGTNLSTLNVSGASTLSTLNVTGSLTVPTINGATNITGYLTVPGIFFPNTPHPGHRFTFDWDGHIQCYVDDTYVGPIGDIDSVTAGNGLTGGGTTGAVSLAMSGSYSGNFSANGLYGNYINSTGNIDAGGGISGGSINAAGSGSVDCGYLHSRGNCAVAGSTTVGGGLTVSGSADIGSNINCNSLHSNSYVDAVYLQGGDGSAGTLYMYGTGNHINFRWDGGVSGGGAAAYRIDGGAVEKYMATTANAFDLTLAYPGGGPTSAVLGSHDVPGTWYYSFIDYLGSDERIKDHIAETEVDALAVLQQVPVSKFDVKGAVAAWYRNMGMDTTERIASMRDAQPVHVPIGFVAQQVQPHIPDAVAVGRQDGAIPEAPLPVDMLNINRSEFIPYLVRAVQQLAARVEQLEA